MGVLYFARHGTTDDNVSGHLQGRADGPTNQLNAQGRAEAEAAGRVLTGVALDELWVSPLGRAQETARLLIGERTLVPREEPRLMEIDFGQAEGAVMSEWIAATGCGDTWRLAQWETSFPGGESYLDLLARIRLVTLDALACARERNVLLVAHATPVKLMRAVLAGIDPQAALQDWIPNAALYRATGSVPGACVVERLFPAE